MKNLVHIFLCIMLAFVASAVLVQLANPHWTCDAALQPGIDNPDWVLPAPYAHWLPSYKPTAA